MKLEKVEVKGFGKLNNLTLNLKSGLNVVFGTNEAGKTSLQWFIRSMFFGLKGGRATKESGVSPLKRYKPWKGEDYSGFVEYSLDNGQTYRVGRNFNENSVRIFDALFNDISNTFEANRERGVLFAEKQLGINETCFEKTVFIRQMESRIDGDGSKELLNRLTNISQTGFEDVSYRRAEEALRDALKNYVGTEKTSTRPLDKIVSRLQELKAEKEALLQKREALFELERNYEEAHITLKSLKDKETAVSNIREVIRIRRMILKNIKDIENLSEIFYNISNEEEEIQLINKRVEDLEKERVRFSGFSIFSEEDIDELEKEYHKLTSLEEEKIRLKAEMSKKEAEMKLLETALESLQAFIEIDSTMVEELIEKNKKLTELKMEREKGNSSSISDSVSRSRSKLKAFALSLILLAALTMGLLVSGYLINSAAYFAAGGTALVWIVILFMRIREAARFKKLGSDKKLMFISANNLNEEINKNESWIKEKLSSTRTASIEEFIMKKTEAGEKKQMLIALKAETEDLNMQLLQNSGKLTVVRAKIGQTLLWAGIVKDISDEINNEHIKNFKYGVRRFSGIEPSAKFTSQRIIDIKKNEEVQFRNAASIIGNSCDGLVQLLQACKELENENIQFEKKLETHMEFIQKHDKFGILASLRENQDREGLIATLDDADRLVAIEEESLKEQNRKMELEARELEVRINTLSNDGDMLQRVEEEILELEGKKNHLEDMNISLKTALEVMKEASDEIQRDFVPVLNQRMSSSISRISGGRYQDLRANSSLGLNAIAPETGDIVSAGLLSGGTIDQMYLALRISMAEMLTSNNENLPFFMDEIFAQYDDKRTRETLHFLKDLSMDRQLILFTCKGRELEMVRELWGSEVNVIELG